MPSISSTGLDQVLRGNGAWVSNNLQISGQTAFTAKVALSGPDLTNTALQFGLTLEFSYDTPPQGQQPSNWTVVDSATVAVVPVIGGGFDGPRVTATNPPRLPTFVRSTLTILNGLQSAGVTLSAA